MIRLKKTQNFVVSGEEKYTLETKKYKVLSLDKKKDNFKIKHKENEYIVKTDNKVFAGEIVSLKQNKCTVLLNGNTYNFTIDTESSFKRKEQLNKNKPVNTTCEISAPMPGKITEILVAEGAQVEKGTSLLLLEAMKMQNQILCNQSGVVTKIMVRNGENVMVNQLMIVIE